VGTPVRRVDGPAIVSGRAGYGIDVRVPGMRYAAVARGPVAGGRAVRWDEAKARAVEGVRGVYPVSTGIAGRRGRHVVGPVRPRRALDRLGWRPRTHR
jgi:isoquinoline 1-oxidoreductase beta subunit